MGGGASLGWDGGVGTGSLGDNGEIVGDIDGWGIISRPFCCLGLHVADVGIMCTEYEVGTWGSIRYLHVRRTGMY